MTLVNATASAHHFSVKLSLFMCMLAACSGLPPQCSTFSSIDAVTVCNLVPRPHLLTERGGGGGEWVAEPDRISWASVHFCA